MTAVLAEPRLSERLDVRFAYRFVALATFVLSAWTVLSPTWQAMRRLTTGLVLVATRATGLPAALFDGDIVMFTRGEHSFSYHVTDECTGAEVMLTYLLAVAAYPTGLRQRFLGLVGIPLLMALNILRLLVLGWVGLYWEEAFDDIHLYWWQALYIAGTGLVWFLWAWFVAGRTERPRSKVSRAFLTVPATVLGVLIGMAALGSWAGLTDMHAGVLATTREFLGERLWAGTVPVAWTSGDRRIVEYGLLSATIALFFAAPGIDLRRRARAAVTIGVAVSFGVEVVLAILLVTLQVNDPGSLAQATAGSLVALTWTLHIGVVLIAWQTWLVREQLRRERLAARREGARHGSTHRLARVASAPRVRTTTRWLDSGSPILPTRDLRRRRKS